MQANTDSTADNTVSPTHGPWEAIAPEIDSPFKGVVVRDDRYHDSCRTICVVAEAGGYVDPRNPEDLAGDYANTFLIAAAPELLAACESAYEFLHGTLGYCDDDSTDSVGMLKLSIAKAKGEA